MKKTTKLLSILLALVMMLSCFTMGAYAAVAQYKTVANLESNAAYSPYGTVTRLSTDERMSIVFDALDKLLAPMSSLNMGKVIDNILGLNLTINLTSVDNIIKTIDDVKTLKAAGAYSFAAAFVDLGIVEDLQMGNWTAGYSRAGNNQVDIVKNICNLLLGNTSLINTVLTDGIKLGMIASFIKGLDLTSINKMVTDLPGMVKGLVFPLLSRADDTSANRTTYSGTSASLTSVLDSFVQGIFSKPMNWTSYREDAAGNSLNATVALPVEAEGSSRYFVKEGDTIAQYDYQYSNDNKTLIGTFQKTVTYTKALEYEGAASYIYKAPEGYTGDQTLKYYSAGDKGYFLPSVRDAMSAGTMSFSFSSDSDSAASLLYKFIPYVFAEMAPTVLNGSVKKLIAGLFDVTFEKVGDKGDAAVAALASKTGNPANFFTKDQDFYLWEYSDYKVIDGVPYYRFQDEYFVGTIPENISTYYYMFNWDWNITDDFINEFIPSIANDGTVTNSAAGYSTILQGLNKFVKKLIDNFLVDSFTFKGTTYTPKATIAWQTGDNSLAIGNIVKAAREIFSMAPTEIFDEYYNDPDFSPYYNMMMNGTQKQAVTGLLAAVIEMLMPQAILPKEAVLCKTVGTDDATDVPFIALGVVILREVCTQLMPSYNFDALIYTDYNTKTLLRGAAYNYDYWVDTALTMGVDLGMFYLRNIADIGEDDTTNGYYGAMKNLGAAPSNNGDTFTYAAGGTYIGTTPAWQYKVDWVIDWALSSSKEWCWGFEKLIDCGSTVDLATYQDPWAKLNTVLLGLLPLDNLLNQSDATSTSGTWLENCLRTKFVDGLCELNLTKIVSLLNIPTGYLRNGNVLTQVVTIVRNLLNKVLYKVAGNVDIVPSSITTIDSLLVQNTIKSIASTLVGKLYAAVNNGLLVPVLPLVNMFIGWKTDAQTYAEPSIYFSSSSGDTYLLKASTNTLKFTNNSAGMLQTHRNSTTEDHAYTITVSSVATDTDGCSVSGAPCDVAPGATADLAVTTPSGAGVVRFIVTYYYTGKDGQKMGGDQTKVYYAYYTETGDEEWVSGRYSGDDDTGYTGINDYSKYVFTTDLYASVTNYTATVYMSNPAVGTKAKGIYFEAINADTAVQSPASNYFTFITTAEAPNYGWTNSDKGVESASFTGRIFKPVNSGVTEATFNEENSIANNLYGTYDMGVIAVKYGYWTQPFSKYYTNSGKAKSVEVDFIYYNDYSISKVMDKYVGYNLLESDFTSAGASAFTTYEAALKKVVELANTPKLTTYVTVVQPQIEAAIAALDTAYEALESYKATAASQASGISEVKTALDAVETDPSKDIDFEDYNLFEYFQYEKQRTAARNMIKSTLAPTAPEAYIEGESLPAAAISAIATAAGTNYATGINATILQPSAEAMEAYNIASGAFVPAEHSDLETADQAAKLTYYANFMKANPRNPIYKTFLAKEITAAAAQNYVEANYSTDSWAAYATALAHAQEVNNKANAMQSEIFDAKYTLMEAQNNLIPADASMKDNGYLDAELTDLIAQAEAIATYYGQYFRTADGVEAADAFAQLVKALGVRYDVTVDGVDYEGILYGHSAYTFTDYDRLNTNKEKAKVDVAADKLKAALDNFVSTVIVEKADETTVVTQAVKLISNIAPLSLASTDAVLAHVKASDPAAQLAVTATTLGLGTGTKVAATVAGVPIATYYVVIYGDINGDGAIDGFDVAKADLNLYKGVSLTDVQNVAADATKDSVVNANDISAIEAATIGSSTISQA